MSKLTQNIDIIMIKKSSLFFVSLFMLFFINGIFSQNTPVYDTLQTQFQIEHLSFAPVWSSDVSKQNYIKKYDPSTLPFFCKMEHHIENASKIGFRFRLGDLNYVNMLENKR